MYIPKHFEQSNIEMMHCLIQANPFVTLVCQGSAGLFANHIPMELHKHPQPNGVLMGHVARSNPLWREAEQGIDALAIVQGPQAYVTPSWYPSKIETGRVVPTWNYAVVHAHGKLRAIEDRQSLRAHLERLTQQQESAFAEPWAIADAPSDYIDKMLKAIVGVELTITQLVGKWKLSQNRSAQDKAGVAIGLNQMGEQELVKMMEASQD